jgi:ATP-dependent Clp protease ATP-binding subunit ClpA
MFERLTSRGRTAFAEARKAAIRFRHDFIGAEHILLGLLAGENEATAALRRLGVDLAALRRAVEDDAGRGNAPEYQGFVPFTPRAKRAIEEATAIARGLANKHLGCEHLVLGLLAEGEGIAARALERFVSFEKLRASAVAVRGGLATSVEKLLRTYLSTEDAALDWADPDAWRALVGAHRAAAALGHELIEGEHLLLAILEAGNSTAVRALARLGVEASGARAAIERHMEPRPPAHTKPGHAFSLRGKRILDLAFEEAGPDELIGSEHLLLALLAEGRGVAARALAALGVELEQFRAAVAAARAEKEGDAAG